MKKEDESYENITQHSIINNYFSLGFHFPFSSSYKRIGIDAAIALDFHHKREAHPEKFKSRFGNKVRYRFAIRINVHIRKLHDDWKHKIILW